MPLPPPPAVYDDERFYASLPELTEFTEVTQFDRYAVAPSSSLVVLTDVVGSTRAIELGRYKDVNAIGVASIVAVCNAMRDVDLPFIFGGDGATLLVPGSRRAAAERALRGVRALAESSFGLGLRASIVPLADLEAEGYVARVARFRASEHSRLAMFSGSAWSEAERWFKDPRIGHRYAVSADGDGAADFDGFECRWQPMRSQRGHTVSLIVRALDASESGRADTYARVLTGFEQLVDGEACHPVKVRAMKLNGLFGDFSVEARVRAGLEGAEAVDAAAQRAKRQSLIGRALMATGTTGGDFDGAAYRREFVENCDFRKFDEALRMVVDLDAGELSRLEAFLAREHREGRIAYGMHDAEAALVTCLGRSYSGDHVHFVDGGDGGYALAAKKLKAQLAHLRVGALALAV